MHQWNKKIDNTFKLLAHASIKLYQKKKGLLNIKCQISKHQQNQNLFFLNYSPHALTNPPNFFFLGQIFKHKQNQNKKETQF
jgi:hypothetical protein